MEIRHGWRLAFAFLFLFSPQESDSQELCNPSRSEIFERFEASQNRMGFRNSGGLLDGGVCWWHSRLQRSSIYLARFEPNLPRPSIPDSREIIQHLIRFDQVVTIPGYSNFNEFSSDHRDLIQRELNEWQIRDGFIHQQWLRGIYGRPSMPPEVLRERMARIYVKFKAAKPGLWVMAQFPGITSHALLFIGMTRTTEGFRLRVIDSNRPDETRELVYRYGDRSIRLGNDTFTPFVGFQSDQERIDAALDAYCPGPVPLSTETARHSG